MCMVVEIREKIPKIKNDDVFKFLKLGVGDYLINNKILIERKTESGFLGSYTSKHLDNQLTQMNKTKMNTFLLLEMPDIKGIYYTINNRNENMQKICREISLRFQIKIVYTNTWIETMSFLLFCYNDK